MNRRLQSQSCRSVYQILDRNPGGCAISQLEIALDADLSINTVQKALAILHRHQVIERCGGRPYSYRVLRKIEFV